MKIIDQFERVVTDTAAPITVESVNCKMIEIAAFDGVVPNNKSIYFGPATVAVGEGHTIAAGAVYETPRFINSSGDTIDSSTLFLVAASDQKARITLWE